MHTGMAKWFYSLAGILLNQIKSNEKRWMRNEDAANASISLYFVVNIVVVMECGNYPTRFSCEQETIAGKMMLCNG